MKLTGLVTPLGSTGTRPLTRVAVLPSIEDRLLLPVVCSALVAAPVGKTLLLTTTAPVLTAVILESIDDRLLLPVVCDALVLAPVGNGSEVFVRYAFAESLLKPK